jgi:hypothetical protein
MVAHFFEERCRQPLIDGIVFGYQHLKRLFRSPGRCVLHSCSRPGSRSSGHDRQQGLQLRCGFGASGKAGEKMERASFA